MIQPPQTRMVLWVEETFFPSYVFSLVLHLAAITLTATVIPGYYRVCTGTATPPGCQINTCHCQHVCCVSQDGLKSMVEITGDRQDQDQDKLYYPREAI